MTTEISNPTNPLRVRFTRKPVDLQEVLAATPYDERPEPVVISETRALTTAEYDVFANTLLQDRVAPQHLVEDVIGKVASVAAVEEEPDRFEGLAGGVRDRGHRDWPGGLGIVVHRAKKAPGFVLGGGDLLGGGHRFLLRLIVATPV
jgi:hypothetical protein